MADPIPANIGSRAMVKITATLPRESLRKRRASAVRRSANPAFAILHQILIAIPGGTRDHNGEPFAKFYLHRYICNADDVQCLIKSERTWSGFSMGEPWPAASARLIRTTM